ncbi:MAG TPA: hypothetical protein P5280_03880 [Cyclobacteriaceae bacterium]|nr:hypothetical protein [Cyclobacteriaceae bacterium]
MAQGCKHSNCWPEDTGCNIEGEADYRQCKYWQSSGDGKDESVSNQTADQILPWHGNSLGTTDLFFVAGRSQPLVIGVVGAQSAGKTTFLSSLYLSLNKTPQLTTGSFAGSYTLGGWENIAHYLRWDGNRYPGFPPHTTSEQSRIPGLLHVAFRNPKGQLRDILFTDAPGEWFSRWAVDKHDPTAKGADWVDHFASGFLFFVDSEAFAGNQRGIARSDLQNLLHQLSATVRNRPVAVIWAKSDVAIAEAIRRRLQTDFQSTLKNYKEFAVFAAPKDTMAENRGEGVSDSVEWVLESVETVRNAAIRIPPVLDSDAFLAYRGREL